jgi:hypothetical protein
MVYQTPTQLRIKSNSVAPELRDPVNHELK